MEAPGHLPSVPSCKSSTDSISTPSIFTGVLTAKGGDVTTALVKLIDIPTVVTSVLGCAVQNTCLQKRAIIRQTR